MRNVRMALLSVLVGLAACAAGPSSDTADPAPSSATMARGEMPGSTPSSARGRSASAPLSGDTEDFFLLMPPAPRDGDARDTADRRIFRETRALAGSPRWQMAADDAELGTAAMLKHFSCSLGLEATPQQLPRMVALLQKATREAARSVGRAKEHYQRKRPFLVDEGATCVPASSIGESFDYPSGHATAGWAWALTLAQLDPAHAQPILARGRAIGDSRVVCGMHNASAVEAARFITGAAMTVVAASPAYQADLAAARAELDALRASGQAARPAAARCEQEGELVKSYW